ncbi:MAG: hypothetical protein K1X71_20185 [Pirellulales bacterium]|nr:hypothetical protein [Pirellulales bacterium]
MRAIWLIALLFSLVGCEKPSASKAPVTIDPHDVPITEADVTLPANFAEAIPRIKGYRDSIRQLITAGTPAQAHRDLDELDIVLNKLPSIAKDSGVPNEQWESINLAAQELRASFNELHAAIDAKREPDYAAVAASIDQAIAKLEQVP